MIDVQRLRRAMSDARGRRISMRETYPEAVARKYNDQEAAAAEMARLGFKNPTTANETTRLLNDYVTLSNDMWRVVSAAHAFVAHPLAGTQYEELEKAIAHYFKVYPDHRGRP